MAKELIQGKRMVIEGLWSPNHRSCELNPEQLISIIVDDGLWRKHVRNTQIKIVEIEGDESKG